MEIKNTLDMDYIYRIYKYVPLLYLFIEVHEQRPFTDGFNNIYTISHNKYFYNFIYLLQTHMFHSMHHLMLSEETTYKRFATIYRL